jgi:hypothetical protein
MSRRTTLIQMLIPYVAVGLGLLASAIDGGAGPLPPQTAEAEALALVYVGHRLQSFGDAEPRTRRCEQPGAATTR